MMMTNLTIICFGRTKVIIIIAAVVCSTVVSMITRHIAVHAHRRHCDETVMQRRREHDDTDLSHSRAYTITSHRTVFNPFMREIDIEI